MSMSFIYVVLLADVLKTTRVFCGAAFLKNGVMR